jgi:DNA-binding Lrp family transcriptional regulator
LVIDVLHITGEVFLMPKIPSPLRDEQDQLIALHLIEDPSATDDDIVSRTKFSKSTVQRHRSEMEKDGVLLSKASLIRDWAVIGFPLRFRVDILINQLELRNELQGGGPEDCPDNIKPSRPVNTQEGLALFIKQKLTEYVAWRIESNKEEDGRNHSDRLTADEFRKSIVVQDVTILLGHHADLAVTLRAKNIAAMRKFVTSGLRMMRGITGTSTAHEVWSCVDGDL